MAPSSPDAWKLLSHMDEPTIVTGSREIFFLLTSPYNLIYLTLYKTPFGVRDLVYPERSRRAPLFFFSAAISGLANPKQPKSRPLESIIYETQFS